MRKNSFNGSLYRMAGVIVMLAMLLAGAAGAGAQPGQRTFPETGKTVKGKFLAYWDSHGGLAQQGFPISEEFVEVSELNGKPYTVQYFERAVFELHPENNPPHDVLLSQLGTFQYRKKYGAAGAPNQTVSTANPRHFPETGKTMGGKFRAYWESRGGLAQQGFPISNEFVEVSDLNGKPYTVQYFERAVFELHPENNPPHDVLLSQLGTFQYRAKYAGGANPTPAPPAQPQNKNANVTPRCGVAGTSFTYTAQGFTPNEPLSFWFTTPSGETLGTAAPLEASHDGGFQFPIPTRAEFAQAPGWWALTFQGGFSRHQSIGYFYVARNAAECAGIGGGGGGQPQPTAVPPTGGGCDVSGSRNGRAEPTTIRAGQTVRIFVSGLTPNEPISFWLTAPNGDVVGTARPLNASHQGAFYIDLPTEASWASLPGRWAVTFQGGFSQIQAVIFFCVTP